MAESIVDYAIDDLFSSTGIGSLDKAIGLNLHGINYQQAPTLVPRNKEQPGYVFFTRPQLNMQGDNIRNMRQFYDLLSDDPVSLYRWVRCTLDPRLGAGYRYLNVEAPVVSSPLVDNENAFIPALTNNLVTLTGWPEETMTMQRSKEDVYRGTRTQPNGVSLINSSYTLNATFRNTYSDPLIHLFHYWILYMSSTSTLGTLRPYADFEAMDYLDCNTRIYRIVLDPQRERVTKIYATGAAIPSTNSVSQSADYNRALPIADVNKDLTISFECDGMYILDPILYYTFNSVVESFCAAMREPYRASAMVKLEKSEQNMFRSLCYPRIDPATSAFELYVPAYVYRARLEKLGELQGPDAPYEGPNEPDQTIEEPEPDEPDWI